MTLEIRPAVPTDAEQIPTFIIELADYERARHEVVIDVRGIRCSLFVKGSLTRVLMCLSEGRPIGYAVYFCSYSTWLGRNGIYLEDLYVTPEYRGADTSRRLLRELAHEAVVNDCGRLEWSMLGWSQPAIDFHRSIGALPQNERVCYRLDGEALRKMAEQLAASRRRYRGSMWRQDGQRLAIFTSFSPRTPDALRPVAAFPL